MESDTAQSVEDSLRVLDKGSVRLIQHMGGDLMVLASARVSNGNALSEASKGIAADQRLINFLMKHRHGTPFEHSVFTFHVKAPIFVVREWMRHRMSSYNEISGRYVEFESPDFYIPKHMRIPAEGNKQGSVFPDPEKRFKFHDYLNLSVDEYDEQTALWIEDACNDAWTSYKGLLATGLAKELARIILPLNFYTQFYWTVNARSLMNFLSLRIQSDAQWEIQQYAVKLAETFAKEMPMTYLAWQENGKLSP